MKQPPKPYQNSSGHIGYILRQAQHAIHLAIESSLKELNITHSQFAVLSILEFEDNLHSADIARLSMFSPQATNVLINKLEKSDHIKRQSHPIHGRILVINITTSGKAILRKCRKRVDAIEQKMCQGINKKEENTIRNWLIACTQIER